jgi:electron transfer flavoprotein beta subunit
MALSVVVCIKQVPNPEHFSKVFLDPETKTINREGIPVITNPLDRNALEEGLRIRQRFSGGVAVLTMGPPQARKSLEEALAVGADEAFLLCDRAFAAADTLATAYTVARGIQKIGHFDLILCGNETVDSGTGQVGPQIAQFLGITCITCVEEIAFKEETLTVKRALERGYMRVRVNPPALLTVTKDINKPRLPTAFGIMEATEKEIKVWGYEDIEAELNGIGSKGSPTKVIKTFEQPRRRKGEIMTGSPEEMVKKAIRRIEELGGADLIS